MENKYWYAVLAYEDDDDWGTGSFDYDEAVQMVQKYLKDGGLIAVIDESGGEPMCIDEIREF